MNTQNNDLTVALDNNRCPSTDQNTDSNLLQPTNSFFKNKLSLKTCSSSVTIYKEELLQIKDYRKERRIFQQLISNYSSTSRKITELKKTIAEICQSDQLQDGKNLNLSTPIEIPEWIQDQNVSKNNLNFNNYCMIWLRSMGYQTRNNKKYVINRSNMELSALKLGKAVQFYDKLGADFLSTQDRFDLILRTCANGWEYFINRMRQAVNSSQHQ